jgi:hypothetical protein
MLQPPAVKQEISRFPVKELTDMPGSQTTQGQCEARDGAPPCVAFRYANSVGTLNIIAFAARWLACPRPCQRFASYLAVRRASLGDSVTRYVFTVRDFHPLLLAGLPAH